MKNDIEKEYEEFAYVVSHDLNAPLRQINSFTNLLMDDLGDSVSEDQALYRSMIHKAIVEAQTSLEGLLAFSRINAEAKEVTAISLVSIFDDVLGDLEEKIKFCGADIQFGPMLNEIYGDYKTLKCAFYELIDNALKFQPSGQKPIIKISSMRNQGKIIIDFEDNGIGVAPENYEKIFTVLRRFHSESEYTGHGVGLSLAKKIAQIHNGSIEIDSIIDQKSIFHFIIEEQ
jgi:light-regulated signal transduction histidine kinase (bacteriophytochrome)